MLPPKPQPRQQPPLAVGKFAAIKERPQAGDRAPEGCAVLGEQNGVAGLEDLLADVVGQEFMLIQLEVLGVAEEVLAHQDLDEGDADADLIKLKPKIQIPVEYKTIESRMLAPALGLHFGHLVNAAVVARDAAAVDDAGVVALGDHRGDCRVKMRLQRDVDIGVNEVVGIGGLKKAREQVGKDRKGREGGVAVDVADAALQVWRGFETSGNGGMVLGELGREQLHGDACGLCMCLRLQHAGERDRLHVGKFGVAAGHKNIDQVGDARPGRGGWH